MLSAIEHLVRLHPASYYAYWERRQSDFSAFEELEGRPVRRRHEYEAEGSESTWMIGKVAAVAAMFILFCGVLTAIAQLAGESADPGQQPVVEASASTVAR